MKKLLLICLIIFNLNIIAADHGGAGTGAEVGAGIVDDRLLGEAREKHLDRLFQDVLDIFTIVKKSVAPYGLRLKSVTVSPECCRTKGKLYVERVDYFAALYTPWGRVCVFNGCFHSYLEKIEAVEAVKGQFTNNLELELVGNINDSCIKRKIFQPQSASLVLLPQGIVHEIIKFNGMLLPAGIVPDRTPEEWQVDWDERTLRHSGWSPLRAAFCIAVARAQLYTRAKAKSPFCYSVGLGKFVHPESSIHVERLE